MTKRSTHFPPPDANDLSHPALLQWAPGLRPLSLGRGSPRAGGATRLWEGGQAHPSPGRQQDAVHTTQALTARVTLPLEPTIHLPGTGFPCHWCGFSSFAALLQLPPDPLRHLLRDCPSGRWPQPAKPHPAREYREPIFYLDGTLGAIFGPLLFFINFRSFIFPITRKDSLKIPPRQWFLSGSSL